MRSTVALSLAALASLSAGQATSQYDYPYRIDPNSVSTTDRGTHTYLP
jgi:chitodextrinase